MTRRELLAGGVCLCGGAAGATPRSNCCSTPEIEPESVAAGATSITIDLARAPSLAGAGDAANIPSHDIIVVHKARGEYFACSRRCPHGKTPVVSYIRSRAVLQCNSFGHSIFGLDGKVLKGPAGAPLKSYPVRVSGGKLEVTLV